MASPEYLALKALERPTEDRPGDMWLCRRLGHVWVFNAHKRGQARRNRMNTFHLYAWGRPCLVGRPAAWRDNDNNACGWDPRADHGERWEYVGNMFDLLPFAALAQKHRPDSDTAQCFSTKGDERR